MSTQSPLLAGRRPAPHVTAGFTLVRRLADRPAEVFIHAGGDLELARARQQVT
jgi:hypothetical protein